MSLSDYFLGLMAPINFIWIHKTTHELTLDFIEQEHEEITIFAESTETLTIQHSD